MTIPAKRFEALDKEFNVAMTSISEADPKQILNTAFNALKELTEQLKKIAQSVKENLDPKKVASEAKKAQESAQKASGLDKVLSTASEAKQTLDAVRESIRDVKGTMRSTFDTGKLNGKNLDRFVSEIFSGDSTAQTLFKQIQSKNRDRATGNITTGRSFVPVSRVETPGNPAEPTFVNGKPGHDYYQLTTLMQRLSGNQYEQSTIDNNMVLRRTVAVTNMAYDAGMTNVMETMRQFTGLRPEVLARATAIVLQEQATRGNIEAIVDISNFITSDNFPILQSPSVIQDAVANFSTPFQTQERNLPQLGTQFLTGMSAIDPGWKNSVVDNRVSTRHLDRVSPQAVKTVHSRMLDNIFAPDNLTAVFNTETDILITAIVAQRPDIVRRIDRISNTFHCRGAICDC